MNDLTVTERKQRLAQAKKGLANVDETLGRAAWRWGSYIKQIADDPAAEYDALAVPWDLPR